MQFNDTIIGQNTSVSGNMKTVANIVVNGQTDGTIFSDGNIIVNQSGIVKGGLECLDFSLYGTLEGKCRAKKVYVSATGKLLGDVISSILKIDEGADFIGCSKKIDQEKNSKLLNTEPVYEI